MNATAHLYAREYKGAFEVVDAAVETSKSSGSTVRIIMDGARLSRERIHEHLARFCDLKDISETMTHYTGVYEPPGGPEWSVELANDDTESV